MKFQVGQQVQFDFVVHHVADRANRHDHGTADVRIALQEYGEGDRLYLVSTLKRLRVLREGEMR